MVPVDRGSALADLVVRGSAPQDLVAFKVVAQLDPVALVVPVVRAVASLVVPVVRAVALVPQVVPVAVVVASRVAPVQAVAAQLPALLAVPVDDLRVDASPSAPSVKSSTTCRRLR